MVKARKHSSGSSHEIGVLASMHNSPTICLKSTQISAFLVEAAQVSEMILLP